MKKVVLYPTSCLTGFSEVMQHEEPKGLHNILWITSLLIVSLIAFLFFGRIDDVVRAQGIVRPKSNVSCVKNITSGEIQELYFKPGDYVHSGDRLLSIKPDALEAQKKSVLAQKIEAEEKVLGLGRILEDLAEGKAFSTSEAPFAKARFSAYLDQVKLLQAKADRLGKLYREEKELPEFSTTKSQIEEKKYNYQFAILECEEYKSNFKSQIRQEFDNSKLNLENLTQQLAQVEVALGNLVLVSPVDGYVQEISSLNPGDYIFTDQQILNIVPSSESNCRIELNIPANEMGKIKKGQKVHLRFPAFPYSEFRGIDGKLNLIQPDAQSTSTGELFFKAYAESDSMYLKSKDGSQFQIKPGFAVDGRIVLENQSLLQFFLRKLDLDL